MSTTESSAGPSLAGAVRRLHHMQSSGFDAPDGEVLGLPSRALKDRSYSLDGRLSCVDAVMGAVWQIQRDLDLVESEKGT